MKAARRKGCRPFRPHSWFGKRRPRGAENANGGKAATPNTRETQAKKPPHQVRGRRWYKLLAVAGLLALTVMAMPATALADDPG